MAVLKACAGLAMLAVASASAECMDVTEENNKECHKNVKWAMTTGIKKNVSYYPAGTSTQADFQCALFLKKGEAADGPSWDCSLPPCESISDAMKAEGGKIVKACIVKPEAAAPKAESGPSLEWWGWVLIVAAVALATIGVLFALGFFAEKKPKKKRAIKVPEPEPAPVETSMTAVPVYTAVAPPVYTYSAPAPVYQATQSISVAAPSVVTAAPTYTTAAPVTGSVVMAAPGPSVSVPAPVGSVVVPAPVA